MGGLSADEQSIINAVRKAGTIPEAALDEAVEQFLSEKQRNSKITLDSWLPEFLTRKVDSEIVYETLSNISMPAGPNPTGATVAYDDMLPTERPGLEQRLELPDQYKFVKLLGKGGMGGVIRVTDTKFDRPAALKYPLDEDALPHFEREARYHGQMRHKFIPPVYDRGTLPNGLPYLVMELIDGETLGAIDSGLRVRPKKYRAEYPLERILRLLVDICDGVSYLHTEHGIIHRDLKPDNIMVGKYSDLQIMDLGLAKRLQDPEIKIKKDRVQPSGQGDRTSLTIQVTVNDGEVKGTLSHMAPEQACAEPAFASDQYAIAAIAYEILTGVPFRTFPDNLTSMNMLARIVSGKGFVGFEPPKKLAKPLQDIIMRGLNPDPTLRYASVADMREDFLAYLTDVEVKQHKDVKAHKYNLFERGKIFLREHAVPVVAGGLVIAGGLGLLALNENKNRSVAEKEKIAANERADKLNAELAAKKFKDERDVLKTERDIRQEASIELAKAIDFYKRGDLENAIKSCESALKIDVNYPDAYYERGLIYYDSLKGKEAIDDFIQANTLNKDASKGGTGKPHTPALFYAGLVSFDLKGNIENAGTFFRKLLEEVSNEDEPYVLHAKVFVSYMDGVQTSNEIKTLQSQGKRTDELEARTKKFFEEAVNCADKAVKKFPKMWEGSWELAWLSCEGLTTGQFNHPELRPYRNYGNATMLLEKALELNPGHLRSEFLILPLYINEGKYDESVEIAESMVKKHPKIAACYTKLGYVYLLKGDSQKSIDCLLKAESMGVKSSENYGLLSAASIELERYEDAEKYSTLAIELGEFSVHYALRSEARIKKRDITGSLEDAAIALNKNPENERAYFSRALCYVQKKEYQNAASDFVKSRSLGFGRASAELGILYYELYQKTGETEYATNAVNALNDYQATKDSYKKQETKAILERLTKK